MEHNTLVKYGFKKGVEQPVFDPESETQYRSQYNSIHLKFDLEPSWQNKKRKKLNSKNPSESKHKRKNNTSVIETKFHNYDLSLAKPSSTIQQGEKQKMVDDNNVHQEKS
jgi:hypothetical protein